MEHQHNQTLADIARTETIVAHLVHVVEDHESRIRWVERGISYGSGIGFAAYFIATKFFGL